MVLTRKLLDFRISQIGRIKTIVDMRRIRKEIPLIGIKISTIPRTSDIRRTITRILIMSKRNATKADPQSDIP